MNRVTKRLPVLGEEGPSFMQGLALGALVGAAIAGSTLWSRWRRGNAVASEPEPPILTSDPGDKRIADPGTPPPAAST